METVNLTISGMSCGHCVGQVQKALAGLDGVAVEQVRVGAAELRFDPTVQTPRDIAAAVTDAGYQAQPAGRAG